jgi:hypothetical protein
MLSIGFITKIVNYRFTSEMVINYKLSSYFDKLGEVAGTLILDDTNLATEEAEKIVSDLRNFQTSMRLRKLYVKNALKRFQI